MQNLALILGCLACMGRGRRVQSLSQLLRESPVAQGQQPSQSHDRLSRARQLATLLLASSTADAFNPSSPGPFFSRSTHPQMFGPKNMLRTDAQTQVEETIAKSPVVLVGSSKDPVFQEAIKFLMKVTLPPPQVDIDETSPEDAKEIQDHMEKLTGSRELPNIWVNRRCIGGLAEAKEMNEKEELKPLCAAAWDRFNSERKGLLDSPLGKTEEEWKKELRPRVYKILRKGDMELPRSHDYCEFFPETGCFTCKGCDLPLYSAASKFEASPVCGWPTFDRCFYSKEWGCHVFVLENGSPALQLACTKCSCRLGYLYFDDEREENPTGERHAVNGMSLVYGEEAPAAEDHWEDNVQLVYGNE